MKICFISNYFNHHQKPLCDALYSRLGGGFSFVATIPMREERKKLGYEMEVIPNYVKTCYTGEADMQTCQRLIAEADVVISGSAPNALVRQRINENKPVFRYSERPLKFGLEIHKYIPRLIKWNMQNPKGAPIYALCASAYAPKDYSRFGLFLGRTYRWGYFPEAKKYNEEALLDGKNPTEILWCGRFIKCKHAEDVVTAAKILKEQGYDFTLSMIGTGELEQQLREQISETGVGDRIRMLGSMKPEQVREHMERAGIYLFTSDKQEGWGAVLNESMNSGCAVIASHVIGSVPFLVKDGENGLIYRSGDVKMLCEKIKYLLDNKDEQRRLGRAAYRAITEEWNGENAAERLIAFSTRILEGEKCPDLYGTGPCSKAEVIDEGWIDN